MVAHKEELLCYCTNLTLRTLNVFTFTLNFCLKLGYPVQSYPPNAIPQKAGPGPVPPAAGIQPQNQTLPVQTVINPSGPSNPVPHQVQSYTGKINVCLRSL